MNRCINSALIRAKKASATKTAKTTKEKAEENKANLTMQEMNFQAGLKLQQLADERKKQTNPKTEK